LKLHFLSRVAGNTICVQTSVVVIPAQLVACSFISCLSTDSFIPSFGKDAVGFRGDACAAGVAGPDRGWLKDRLMLLDACFEANEEAPSAPTNPTVAIIPAQPQPVRCSGILYCCPSGLVENGLLVNKTCIQNVKRFRAPNQQSHRS
jgi:hypothetical protein